MLFKFPLLFNLFFFLEFFSNNIKEYTIIVYVC